MLFRSEVSSLCDRVTVLRHGLNVITREVAGLDAAQLGRFMLGEAPPPPGQPPQTQPGQVALRLEAVRAQGLSGIELELRSGEILALGGIDGNGQGPLEQVLAGVRTLHSGSIELLCPPLALLSGERERTGLVLELAIEENLALPQAAHRHGFLSPRALRGSALDMLQRFGIRARPELPARVLSGGNQQKLCVARALCGGPGVLVAVNPTRGLDVAGTALVREEIRSLTASGCAVLLISTDLDEVLELDHARAVAESHLHVTSSSQGFESASLGKAANASSISNRSQILRPSMRFGFGMRPSATISSHLVVPVPI